jgi:hypothetical protein
MKYKCNRIQIKPTNENTKHKIRQFKLRAQRFYKKCHVKYSNWPKVNTPFVVSTTFRIVRDFSLDTTDNTSNRGCSKTIQLMKKTVLASVYVSSTVVSLG